MRRIGRGSGRSRRGGLRSSSVRQWSRLPFERKGLVRVERGNGEVERARTVNTQTMMIPMNTAKKSQAVHAVALNPVKMLDTITDTMAIVYTTWDIRIGVYKKEVVHLPSTIHINKSHTRPSASSPSCMHTQLRNK